MRKVILGIYCIIILSFIILSGCSQDKFLEAGREFDREYIELCKSVITDTKEISQPKAYELAERLQSDEIAAKIQQLKELLDVMKENQFKKTSYNFVYETTKEEYNRIITIKESYSKWNELSKEQRIKVAREYGVLNVKYSMRINNKD